VIELPDPARDFSYFSDPDGRVHARRRWGELTTTLCGKQPAESWIEQRLVVPFEEATGICLLCRVLVRSTIGEAKEAARRQQLRDDLKQAWANYHARQDRERAAKQ
jgi:hypothetical protein